MEKFYLEIPSIDRKEEALDYLQEFIDYKSDINGSGGLNRLTKGMSYEEWLVDVINRMDDKRNERSFVLSSIVHLASISYI